jgi:hypothetical protein
MRRQLRERLVLRAVEQEGLADIKIQAVMALLEMETQDLMVIRQALEAAEVLEVQTTIMPSRVM